ncbi:MAG TPA: hypothetical protein DEO84_08240 [candidate division Zixibacteria bacterium]|jgi:L-malate glycosyltransferase|nr:hypothetical protein [candidate division Zixibacteria bacterium]HBZ01290.1 hypothetical protein [candidate division Zixibacteria bacterium]
MGENRTINICQLASGDLWAGAEVQMYTLSSSLSRIPEVKLLAVVLNEGRLSERLRQSGVEVIVIDETKHSFVSLRNELIKVLNGRNIDILHSHRYKENLLAAWVRRKCQIKYLVQTVHGIEERRTGIIKLKSRLTTLINIYNSQRHFDRVIAVSSEIKKRLENQYRSDQIVMIHNCIEVSNLAPIKSPSLVKAELKIDAGNLIVGTVGRLVPVKGYEIFLQMAKILVTNHRNLTFLLVGDGPLKRELEKMAGDIGLGGRVLFTGFREDVLSMVNCLDLFVMSSYHEGIPMALLEAMALKKAVVSTAVGGIMEVIENGISGLLVKSGDPQLLAEACESPLDSAEFRQRLGCAAATRINREFSIDNQLRETLIMYQELIEKD